MKWPRSSGILLHPTSLPGDLGVGDLGSVAREFVDRLAECGQSWWQVLPLHPTDFMGSPYAAPSAFAGNPVLIDLQALVDDGLLRESDLEPVVEAASAAAEEEYAADQVTPARLHALAVAFKNWEPDEEFEAFCEAESFWLDDWALFTSLKAAYERKDWRSWPADVVARKPSTLESLRKSLASSVQATRFRQFIFDRQWSSLREYASERGVRIIGDIPIFPAMDSADAWANREIFEVDDSGQATVVAGVPPDYFSETGQKWGNPLYRWDALAESDYEWWFERIRRAMQLADVVRIDHFRGFESYWAVPAEAPNAIRGEWRDGPGDDFFDAVRDEFGAVPFIAEDLGMITEEVLLLRDRHRLPGMKVMHFAFDGNPDHSFLPHMYPERCVAYLGTHDNDTTAGWYENESDETRHQVRTYLSHGDEGIVWAMMESLSASRANMAIYTPQDLFELGSDARMNTPGTSQDNWNWRMTREMLDRDEPWNWLGEMTRRHDRES